MRRSRRTLWLLLAVMAMSLGVVQLTTQSGAPTSSRPRPVAAAEPDPGESRPVKRRDGRPTPRHVERGRFRQKKSAAIWNSLSHARRTVVGFGRSQLASLSERLAGGFTPALRQPVAVRSSSLDSSERSHAAAITLIVELPQSAASESMTYRAGWSGCDAYAFGCDHLGRPLSEDGIGRPAPMHRAIVGKLARLVDMAARFADLATALLDGGGVKVAGTLRVP